MHNLFVSKRVEKIDEFIFLDNDFLSALSQDESLLESIDLFSNSTLFIDPLTRVEFLRDSFSDDQRRLKDEFIGNRLFSVAPNQNTQMDAVYKNAITASNFLIKHKKKESSPDLTDLILIGRCMTYVGCTAIVTGNKKDFSSLLFDTVAVISYEKDATSQFKHFYVIRLKKDAMELMNK